MGGGSRSISAIGDVRALERRFEKVFVRKQPRADDYVDALLVDGITLHMGGMSDPLQPAEEHYGVTREIIELTKRYGCRVLVSTKSDSLRGVAFDPGLHSFQLSVSNVEDSALEPNVPGIAARVRFYEKLKEDGFKVGIRLQPFIPGLSDERIVEVFHDADHFTIEGLKLVPQNAQHVVDMLKATKLDKSLFVQKGLLNLRPDVRTELYAPVVEALEYHAIPYSIADNDMHHLSKCKCCCGDTLVGASTDYNSTALCFRFGRGEYELEDVRRLAERHSDCKVKQLFASNRQEGCSTLMDFFEKRFDRASSPFSPKFLYDVEWLEGDVR